MSKRKKIALISITIITLFSLICGLLYIFLYYLPEKREKEELLRAVEAYRNQKIAQYVEENQKYDDFEVDIAFIGDSLTDGYDVEKYYPEYVVSNRGIGGDTTYGLLARLDVSVYQLRPKIIVMLIGANNFDTMFEDYEDIIIGIKDNLPDTKLVICSLTSMGGEHWGKNNHKAAFNNVKIRAYAEKYGCPYVDLYTALLNFETNEIYEHYTTDGGHLTPAGYEVFTSCVKPVVDKIFKEEFQSHVHSEQIDFAVTPTCTSTGLSEGKHCSVCGDVLVAQEIIDALGHTEVIDKAVEATYLESGRTEGKHCSVCQTILVAQKKIPSLFEELQDHLSNSSSFEDEVSEEILQLYNAILEKYAEENEKYDDYEVDIAFIGDSLTMGYDIEKYYPEYIVSNRGIAGDRTYNLLARLDVSVYQLKPKVIVMLIGANNFDTMFEDYEDIIIGIKENLPETELVICSLTSMGGKWAKNNQKAAFNNFKIKALAEKYNCPYVDLFTPLLNVETNEIHNHYTTDGGHLTTDGYYVLTAQIKPVVDEILKK